MADSEEETDFSMDISTSDIDDNMEITEEVVIINYLSFSNHLVLYSGLIHQIEGSVDDESSTEWSDEEYRDLDMVDDLEMPRQDCKMIIFVNNAVLSKPYLNP